MYFSNLDNEAISAAVLRERHERYEEFSNFKKRMEEENRSIKDKSIRDFLLSIMGAFDNIDMMKKYFDNMHTHHQMKIGFDAIYSDFIESLSNVGVDKIGNIGDHFDVNLHDAVGCSYIDTVDNNCISSIVACGYIYNEVIIRHAKVIVNKNRKK